MSNIQGSIFFIVLGILMIYAKDPFWKSQKFINDLLGHETERTDSWDNSMTRAGAFCIFGGSLVLLANLCQ